MDKTTLDELAAELEINKSTVSRHVRKARELGLVTAPVDDKKGARHGAA